MAIRKTLSAAEEYVVTGSDQVAKGPESYSWFQIVLFSRPVRVFCSRKLILGVTLAAGLVRFFEVTRAGAE